MVGGLFYDRKREVMTDYELIYNAASDSRQRSERLKETRPGYLRNATERQRFTAGIAAVVAAAKAEGMEAERALSFDRLMNTTDLREQSKFYAVKAMPDGVGE